MPARRGGSWHTRTAGDPPCPVRWSKTRWLTGLAAALTTPEGDAVRRALGVHPHTVLDIAELDVAAADSATGRNVTTAHATVAARLGCDAKTVQRARTIVERLGWSTTVDPGRYLSGPERAEAHARHRGDQRRKASTRALLIPAGAASAEPNVHLPRRGVVLSVSALCAYSPTRSARGRQTATRPHRPAEVSSAAPAPQKPQIGLQRLAAGLAARMPWLVRRRHIGHLCHALDNVGLDPNEWTAADLLQLLDEHDRQRGREPLPPRLQHRPIGHLVTRLRDALAEVDQTPAELRRRTAAERAASAAAWAAEQTDRDALRADPDTLSNRVTAARAVLQQARRAAAASGYTPRTLNSPSQPPVAVLGVALARSAVRPTREAGADLLLSGPENPAAARARAAIRRTRQL